MTFFLYDAALNGLYTLLFLQQKFPVHQSLFKGTKDETLIDVAPYIFKAEGDIEIDMPDLSFKEIIVVESSSDLMPLAAHLKDFIYQQVGGRECYFRFWDGRVLKKFLSGCSATQLRIFFGPVEQFIVQDKGDAMQFSFNSYNLVTKHGNLEELSPLLYAFSDAGIPQKTPVNK